MKKILKGIGIVALSFLAGGLFIAWRMENFFLARAETFLIEEYADINKREKEIPKQVDERVKKYNEELYWRAYYEGMTNCKKMDKKLREGMNQVLTPSPKQEL